MTRIHPHGGPARKNDPHPDEAEDQSESDPAPADRDRASGEDPPGDPASAPDPKPLYKRPTPVIVILVLLLGGIAFGVYYYIYTQGHTWTDDAFIEGNISRVAARVPGQVIKVAVDDNQWVKAGDLLVKLDPAIYQAQLDQADAAVAAAMATLAQAKAALPVALANANQAKSQEQEAQANADYAAKQARRTRDMFQRQALSPQDLDRANTQEQSAAAALAAAKQKVASANAKVQQARSDIKAAMAKGKQIRARRKREQLDLSYTTITSPIDGRVTKNDLVEGDYVNAGQSLLAIVRPGVWVKANFKETELTHIRPGQPVDIEVDAFPGHLFKGTVDSIQSGTGSRFSLLPAQNATGNYVKVVQRVPVKITFDDPPDLDRYLLAPGMSVVPTIDIAGGQDAAMRGNVTPPPKAVDESQ